MIVELLFKARPEIRLLGTGDPSARVREKQFARLRNLAGIEN